MWLHNQTVEALHDVDVAQRQIRSDEELVYEQLRNNPNDHDGVIRFYRGQKLMQPSLITLKNSKIRLDSLSVDSQALSGNNKASDAIAAYGVESDQFIACVESDIRYTRSCTTEHPKLVEMMRAVVSAHGKLIDDFVATYP